MKDKLIFRSAANKVSKGNEMSTKNTRQLGKNKYIKVEDLQNFIYDSDEENSNEVLTERDQSREPKETKNIAKNSGTLNDSLNIWYGSSAKTKLNNSSFDLQEKNSVLCYLHQNQVTSAVSKGIESQESCNTTGSVLITNKESVLEEVPKESATEEAEGSKFYCGRKRYSRPEKTSTDIPKRFKVEFNKNMSDAPVHKTLNIELELENHRRNGPVKRRNINTIIEELELITRKLKEGYERCKVPIQWGTPIVKQCSEKWDSHYIPEKLVELYEKRLDANQTCNASFHSMNPENNSEPQKEYKSAEPKSNRNCTDFAEDEVFEASDYDNFDASKNQVEDGINTYNSNLHGRMILRTRTQNRRGHEERISTDAGRDNFGMEKHSRKSSKSNKDKKSSNSKKRAVAVLEGCQDAHSKYHNEETLDSNKNFEKLKLEDLGSPSTSPLIPVKSHLEEKTIHGNLRIVEEEQVACPICGKNFEKKRIESHANHCATETFRD